MDPVLDPVLGLVRGPSLPAIRVRSPATLLTGPRNDHDVGIECVRQGDDCGELGVAAGGEETPDRGRVLADCSSEFRLAEAEVNAARIEPND